MRNVYISVLGLLICSTTITANATQNCYPDPADPSRKICVIQRSDPSGVITPEAIVYEQPKIHVKLPPPTITGCIKYNNDGSCAEWGALGNGYSEGRSTSNDNSSSGNGAKEGVGTVAACTNAHKTTEKACTGATWAENNATSIRQYSSIIEMVASAQDTKAACEATKSLNTLMAAANGTISTMCIAAAMKCRSACSDGYTNKEIKTEELDANNKVTHQGSLSAAVDGVAECNTLANSAKSTAAQSVMDGGKAALASKVCESVDGGSCTGESAYNDENCMQFCMKPGRQSHPKCQIAANSCSNATYAAQNVQYCMCVNNPFNPSCANNASNPIPGNNSGSGLNLEDNTANADYDFDGATGGGRDASVSPQNGGGGSSGGGLGGGSFAMPGDGNGGTGDDPLSKDILTGTGGAGGAAGIFGGSGGYAEGNGSANKGGGAKDGDPGFDLRAFLPGGKNDPKRNPASAGYADPTITKANGLTNWQKVTRKMNEKRPELAP